MNFASNKLFRSEKEVARREARSEWERLDEGGDADYFVRTLSEITAWDFVREYKEKSFALLGLAPGRAVLDVGCGLGDDVIALRERVSPSGRAVGIDLSGELIERARQAAQEQGVAVELEQANAEDLPFEDGAFDSCRSDRVLQHLSDRERAIAEMSRVLVPGGHLVTIDPDWETLVFDLPDRALTRTICRAMCDRVHNGWAAHQTPGLLLAAGFEEIGVVPVTSVLTDLAAARAVLEMDAALEDMVGRGALDRETVSRWYEMVERAEAEGRFFNGMTGFITHARKPSR